MNERVFFFIIIFSIAILLISISVSLYLIFERGAIIGNYDCYILSIFWTPSSCSTKSDKNYECFQLIKQLKIEKYFTVHGLWPSLLSGEIPENCNSGPVIVPNFDNDKKYKENLIILWPGLYSTNIDFWTHEYNRHGYCYMKRSHYNVKDEYKQYFDKCINIFQNGYRDLMEQILPDSKGIYNVSKEKFHYLLTKTNLNITNNDTYSLICDKSTKLLSEIRFIYNLNFERVKSAKFQNNCPDIFVLNFTDEDKMPVYDKYDFYVYSMSYGPTTCKIRGKQCYDILESKNNNQFIIHGLWPSYKNGIKPQMCNIGEDVPIYDNKSAYFNNLKKYWYSLYDSDEYFWTHEYNTHGYCYIKRIEENINDYQIYLNKTFDIYKNNFMDLFEYLYTNYSRFPGEFKVNKTYLFSQLNKKYPNNSYYISCKYIGNEYYLNELKFKLDMNFNFTSEANFLNTCPEQFVIDILERPKEKGKINEEVWKYYDMYVYSIFFQTTTCKIYGYPCYIIIDNFPKNVWTMHGLWPNYKNGTLPDWCNGNNDIDIKIKNESLYNYMKTYWPGLFRSNEGFWGHEYNRHGYCYNKRHNISVNDYDKFFLKAIEIYQKYDLGNIFINMFDEIKKGDVEIHRSELENYLETKGIQRSEYLLLCENFTINNETFSYISEMRMRFDFNFSLYKNETEKTGKDCPDIFMAEFL